MESLCDRVIRQFDTLVPFLAVSREDVFVMIRQHESDWFAPSEGFGLPDTYLTYQVQVSHAALLLGYSYFEAFLADLVKQIYYVRPSMLPEEKDLKLKEILNCNTYEQVFSLIVDKEVFALFYNSMAKILDYFERKFSIKFENTSDREEIIRCSLLRNCIIHNGARADKRLASVSRWSEGAFIDLEPFEVHSFGILGRRLSRNIYEQVETKLLSKGKPPTGGGLDCV